MGSRKNYIKTVKEICEIIISKGYDELKKEFKEVYINKRNADAEKHGNISVEERLLNFNENSKINSSDRIMLNSVIEKIKKDNYEFSNTDKENLVLFNKKIDFAIAQCQYITNIFDGENNFVKGHSLDIVTLFNDIKSSTTINDFLKNTQIDNAFIENLNFKSFLIYLFALIKNIENENKYPIYYKFYQNIAKYFFNIDLLDYDNFCVHFRETNFNTEPKLLEFNTYYYLLGENLKKELKLHDLSNEEVDKRWLKKNLFNVDADSIDNIDVSYNSIQVEFKKYLENNVSKNSVKKYLDGIRFVDKISLKIGLEDLFNWDLHDVDNNKEVLFNNETFRKKNATGNNMYSAAVNHYQKFLKLMEVKEDKMEFQIPPIKPFESFKWRWAVTTPSESVNTPEILLGVLKVLYKHNGKSYATQEFKNDLNDLQNTIDTPLDLAKLDRSIERNIVENLPGYWKGLGLVEIENRIINVTELGVSIIKEDLSTDLFITDLYENLKLPNENLESKATIQEWRDNNIEVSPIKLIFNILFEIKHQSKLPNWYITPEELKDIVIPLSVYSKLPIVQYVNEIIGYRSNIKLYESWPDCVPGDNDFRMVKEYLLFLSNFGLLDLIELKDKSKRYYLNEKSINIFEKYYGPIENDVAVFSLDQIPFDINNFSSACKKAGLVYDDKLITRFISSLTTKPFVILSGLSGSGKTKLAQSFAQWLCEDETQYALVPVGADWTNREPLLGYVNALNNSEYILPENGALQLIIRANENENKPYFLILDEMNLSHVERYFADFLSVMESKDNFKLHSDKENKKSAVPFELSWPKNLFVVGTVNIDETTYMFSPKVLDRANVIEFRVNETEIEGFLKAEKEITSIINIGAAMGSSFVSVAKKELNQTDYSKLNSELLEFFKELQVLGAEFGYRTASEIQTLFSKIDLINPEYSDKTDEKIDIAIMQKLLPKLHGSRRKLLKTLNLLAQKCLTEDQEVIFNDRGIYHLSESNSIKYPLSFEKISRMYKNAIENGFASYAEA